MGQNKSAVKEVSDSSGQNEKGHVHQDSSTKYCDFQFFKSKETIEYINGSKVMFIIRGLPGSGKSIILKQLEYLFKDCVVCSANEYFMHNGSYCFDRSKLHDAYKFCEERATNACKEDKHVVIVYNANIKKWQTEFYSNLAAETCYNVIMVEPGTPWKLNPAELAARNNFGFELEYFMNKVQQWETIIPLYFAWFLNEADSRMLSLVGLAHLEECMKVSHFLNDFKEFSKATNILDLLKYYSLPDSCKHGMLHCTSMFCNGGLVQGSTEYSINPDVIQGYGQCYNLCIIGFVMTPQTFGARVKLGRDEIKLWGTEPKFASPIKANPSRFIPEDTPNNEPPIKSNFSRSIPKDTPNKEPTIRPYHHCLASLVSAHKLEPSFHPTSGEGSRAHITLGCATGVSAVTTGLDLLEVVRLEEQSRQEDYKTYDLPRGTLRHYGQSVWVLYLYQQISVASLFTGFY